jgi:putative nucleotidyltransferase with HDIG domain
MKVAVFSGDEGFITKLRADGDAQCEIQPLSAADFQPQQYHRDLPDLFILDFENLTADKGLTLFQSLRCREHLRKIPVIAVHKDSTSEEINQAQQAGIREVIPKEDDRIPWRERFLHYKPKSVSPGGASPLHSHVGPNFMWSDASKTAFQKQVKMEVKARLELLPSLPTVVAEVSRLAESTRSSAADFEKHIVQDQALTARILRMANAAFFAQEMPVQSIHEATVILGVRTLKALVIASCTSDVLDKPAEGYGYAAGGLWKHSLNCALTSQFLAQKMGYGNKEADEFFVQGLLHDIGKLLLSNFVTQKSQEFEEAILRKRMAPLDAESAILGTNHSLVGIDIAKAWKLPDEVSKVIDGHNDPCRNGEPDEKIAIVHIANYLCRAIRVGIAANSYVEPHLDPHVAQLYSLDEDALAILIEDLNAYLHEANKLFEATSTSSPNSKARPVPEKKETEAAPSASPQSN